MALCSGNRAVRKPLFHTAAQLSGAERVAFLNAVLLGHDIELLSGGWFYYSGLVVYNILFIGLVGVLFVTEKRRRLSTLIHKSAHVFLVKPLRPTPSFLGWLIWLGVGRGRCE
jgi:hypothetical protein